MLQAMRNLASIRPKVHWGRPSSQPWNHGLSHVAISIASMSLGFLAVVPPAHARRTEGRCHLSHPTILTFSPDETVTALAISPAGSLLAAGTNRGRLVVWSLPSGIKRLETIGSRRIEDLAFSPDGRLLAAASVRPGLRIWHMDETPRELVLSEPAQGVMALAFAADGSLLAFGGRDRTVGFYRLHDSKPPMKLSLRLAGHSSWVSALAFSSDGKRLYSGSWDDRIRAFDMASGHLAWESHVHKFPIDALLATPAGLAASSDDGRLTFHRYRDGRVTRQYKPGAVVAMSLQGNLLAGLTWEGKLLFMDSTKARIRCAPRIAKRRHRGTWSLALSRTIVAVGDNRGRVLVYHLPRILLGH